MPLIGEPIVRQEDARLLRGRGRFVDDVHVDGMLHAALFRSSWPHGRIRNIDVAAAAALPGVVGVFTLPDFSAFLKPIRSRIAAMPGFENFLQLPLAADKVRYVGEPMAVVVATSPYVAEDAVSLISAEIDELPPVLSWDGRGERSHPHPRERRHQSLQHQRRPRRRRGGVPDRALRAARDLPRPAPHRRPDGDARAGRGLGPGPAPHDRVRHHQGAVLQPHDAGVRCSTCRKARW